MINLTIALASRERKSGTCAKKINQELTYKDLYGTIDNLWSVLFTTGYLTQKGKAQDGF